MLSWPRHTGRCKFAWLPPVQGEVWRHVDAAKWQWTWAPGRPLVVDLAKQQDCLGSWPRLLRSLKLAVREAADEGSEGDLGRGGTTAAAAAATAGQGNSSSSSAAVPDPADLYAEAWESGQILRQRAVHQTELQVSGCVVVAWWFGWWWVVVVGLIKPNVVHVMARMPARACPANHGYTQTAGALAPGWHAGTEGCLPSKHSQAAGSPARCGAATGKHPGHLVCCGAFSWIQCKPPRL